MFHVLCSSISVIGLLLYVRRYACMYVSFLANSILSNLIDFLHKPMTTMRGNSMSTATEFKSQLWKSNLPTLVSSPLHNSAFGIVSQLYHSPDIILRSF